MANQWGYVDPVQRVHEQRQQMLWPSVPQSSPASLPYLAPVPSPLDLSTVPEITGNAYPPQPQRPVLAELIGAFLGVLFADRLAKRAARKRQELQRLKESLGITDVE